MLYDPIFELSKLIGIDLNIIPDIITFFVLIAIIILTFKSQLSWTLLLSIYAISMAVLSLLGIQSDFNIITIIGKVLGDVF